MKTGISTASLFIRKNTEDALEFLSKNKVDIAEVFLESYCEYNKEFGEELKKRKGATDIHSVHVLTTQFEPQLYSVNERAQSDSFKLLERAMSAGKEIGAKYYTFHGGARFKKTPFKIDFERVGNITQRIIDTCAQFGIMLAYENVHWGYYNYIGFFEELRKRVKGLKATLDVKQARQSGIDYRDFIKEMGEDIATVHLSNVDEFGKMCLPSASGKIDFHDLFTRLKDVGFDGGLIIEAYSGDYGDYDQLFESLYYVKNLAEQIF